MSVIDSDVKILTFNVWGALFRPLSDNFRKFRSEEYKILLGLRNISTQEMTQRIIAADLKIVELSLSTGIHFGFVERFMLLCRMFNLSDLDAQIKLERAYSINASMLKRYPPELVDKNLGDILKALRSKGYILGLFCNSGNNDSSQIQETLVSYGILSYFEPQLRFFSDIEGSVIPQIAMFDKVIYEYDKGLSHRNVLHIGVDRKIDYEGAKTAGFHALHYSPGATRLQEGMITTLSQLV